MAVNAIFPMASARAGMYESFFLRTFSPHEPLGLWIRYTVHKAPGEEPRGSLWFTRFDARAERPLQQKLTTRELSVPEGAWIAVDGAELAPGRAEGRCGEAAWSLRFGSQEQELRHLSPDWLYRAPLPRTKLTSPMPAARFDGEVELGSGESIELRDWPGMLGHNWGSEHAERWIWLHGAGFEDEQRAWIDIGLGRLKIGGRMTPWVANGALSLDGRRHRVGGLGAGRIAVAESASGCRLRLKGERGLSIEATVSAEPQATAGWRYADPDGGEHDVINCSIAGLELDVSLPAAGAHRSLRTAHGGAYELGMRERDHGVPIAPFPDG
jgi:hypothetical protein